jgi:hypothetical protein
LVVIDSWNETTLLRRPSFFLKLQASLLYGIARNSDIERANAPTNKGKMAYNQSVHGGAADKYYLEQGQQQYQQQPQYPQQPYQQQPQQFQQHYPEQPQQYPEQPPMYGNTPVQTNGGGEDGFRRDVQA